jgi:hypothetical protein
MVKLGLQRARQVWVQTRLGSGAMTMHAPDGHAYSFTDSLPGAL